MKIVVTLFLVVAAGAVRVAGVYSQTPIDELPTDVRWYASDADMIRRDATAGGSPTAGRSPAAGGSPRDGLPPTEIEWALAVSDLEPRNGRSRERLILYHFGEFRGEEIVRYSAAGLPVERHRRGADGETEFVETLRYRPDGTLRETLRCDPDGVCTTITYGLPGRGWSERIDDDDFVLLREFDPLGRPIYTRRESTATEEVWEEWLTYEEGVLQRRIVRNGTATTTTTYAAGRAVNEETREGERLIETITRRFDDEGRLVHQETVTRDRSTTETWSYDEVGAWVMERRRNGVVVLRSWRDGDDSGRTIRYRDGRPVMREIYEAGVLVRREIISDGSVVRVEEL